ncbi:ROK family protein [Streptomyces sp. NPDC058293]|uniref:ROK family transcriptional regulator n=1 Tax=Streptomyces sp. NPDC058293 TaxID=3346429 RepID=UPI0036E99F7B
MDSAVASGIREYSELLALVAGGQAISKAGLARHTGLSRATVTKRLDSLGRRGLITGQTGASTGGRPAVEVALTEAVGVVLAVDIGGEHCTAGVLDMGAQVLAADSVELDPAAGPGAAMTAVRDALAAQLETLGRDWYEVRAIAVGVPGQVDVADATPRHSIKLPGWEGFPVAQAFQDLCAAPVLVENDANLMALAEYHRRPAPIDHLLYVKIGSGLGSAFVAEGRLHRGANGFSGEICHTRLPGVGYRDLHCNACGNSGCLGTVVGGQALATRLAEEGVAARSTEDVIRLAQRGDVHALRAVRESAERLGEVLAALVCFANPNAIVIGGALAVLGDDLLAGIRAVVYERALPQSTRRLAIETGALGPEAGLLGGGRLAAAHALSPQGLAGWI